MARTRRINVVKNDIYLFRHNPGRDFRQAVSRRSRLYDEEEIDYKPKTRHYLSKSNLTSSWDDIYKGVFRDSWANGTNQNQNFFNLEQLEILQIFINYNEPCLFSCEDKRKQIYLAVFVEETDISKIWLYTPISRVRYKAMKNSQLDLYNSFKFAKEGISYLVDVPTNSLQNTTIKTISSAYIPDSILPTKNIFINLAIKYNDQRRILQTQPSI